MRVAVLCVIQDGNTQSVNHRQTYQLCWKHQWWHWIEEVWMAQKYLNPIKNSRERQAWNTKIINLLLPRMASTKCEWVLDTEVNNNVRMWNTCNWPVADDAPLWCWHEVEDKCPRITLNTPRHTSQSEGVGTRRMGTLIATHSFLHLTEWWMTVAVRAQCIALCTVCSTQCAVHSFKQYSSTQRHHYTNSCHGELITLANRTTAWHHSVLGAGWVTERKSCFHNSQSFT